MRTKNIEQSSPPKKIIKKSRIDPPEYDDSDCELFPADDSDIDPDFIPYVAGGML